MNETKTGEEILKFVQKDMSDEFCGPGVDGLREKLKELRDANQKEEIADQ